MKLLGDVEPTPSEQQIADQLEEHFKVVPENESRADLEFLARDFEQWDIRTLPVELSTQDVVRARLDEIAKCLEVGAPLAVIFLVGSTLEGLLSDLATSHASDYTGSSTAPKVRGVVIPLPAWTLAELIAVSRALGILRKDVMSHADHVRQFRNYIHPRQQIAENFEPRMITAQIAQQVVFAALEDLAKLAAPERGLKVLSRDEATGIAGVRRAVGGAQESMSAAFIKGYRKNLTNIGTMAASQLHEAIRPNLPTGDVFAKALEPRRRGFSENARASAHSALRQDNIFTKIIESERRRNAEIVDRFRNLFEATLPPNWRGGGLICQTIWKLLY